MQSRAWWELISLCSSMECKVYDCMCFSTDVDALVDEISCKEALITSTKTDQVKKLVMRILCVVTY